MKKWLEQLKKLFFLKLRYAASGLVATSVDYTIYMVLVNRVFSPVVSNVISYSISAVVNFLLQKRFVFTLQRKASTAFVLSLMVSLGGLLLSTTIIYYLSQIEFFAARQYLTKLITTGIVFFYNFYLKRYVFEKRFLSVD